MELYNDTLPSAAGCDSIITLDLTILMRVIDVDTMIGVGDSALLAGSYQSNNLQDKPISACIGSIKAGLSIVIIDGDMIAIH